MSRRYTGDGVKAFRGVEITVNSDGVFRASVGLESYSADTLKALEKQLEKALKKTKVVVAIPVSQLGRGWVTSFARQGHWAQGLGVRHLTITGVHGGTGNLMARDDKTGEIEQLGGGWRSDDLVRRLTPAEVEEYVRLETAKRAAREAFAEFEERVKLEATPKELVKQAQADKVDTPVEPEELDLPDDPRL